jgi:hypothetical protein
MHHPDYVADVTTTIRMKTMNTRALFVTGLAGWLLMTLVWGCDGEDAVAPERGGTYEAALFRTFGGIVAVYSTDGISGTTLCLDNTSYIRINKSDSSYSMRISGTDKVSRTLKILYEDSGSVSLANVTYHKGSGWTLSSWKGEIHFFPLNSLKHSPWHVNFVVVDSPSLSSPFGVELPGASIYMAQNSYLLILGWGTDYFPCT